MKEDVRQYIWKDLIKFFENKNYITNGLTIPFLIGAIRIIENRKVTVSQFIEELTDSNSDGVTTIMKCGNIGEFVIGIMDNESKAIFQQYPGRLYKQFKNLVVTDSSLDKFSNIKDLETYYESLYAEKITKKEYSKNLGVWTDFTSTEKQRINEFINSSR